jgi:hypothetical protein
MYRTGIKTATRAIHCATAAVTLLLAPGSLSAQLCRGGVSFGSATLQGQARVEVESGSTSYLVSGGKGSNDWYGIGTLGVRTYEARNGTTFVLGFGGGRNFQHQLTGRAQHCLELRGEFGTGPDAPGPVRADESSSHATLEFSAGYPLSTAGSLTVTPFGGIGLRFESIVTQGDQTSVSDNDFYQLLSVGVGLTISGQVALQPSVQFPLGRDGGTEPVFTMRVSMNIGSN